MLGSWLKRSEKGVAGKSRSTKGKAQPWDPQRTLAGAKILVAAAAVVAVVVGWRALSLSLYQYAAQQHGRAVTAERVDLADAPAWMSPAVQAWLQRVVVDRVSADPMNGRSLWLAAEALSADPWVRSVEQVRRTPEGHIAVEADYRQPVAVIQGRDGWRLTDREGVSLPGLYSEEQAMQLGLPRITGVTQPPPLPGQRWTATDVLAGLDLALILRDEAFAGQVLAYDVQDRDTRGRVRLTLLTERGMVRWGLPPGQELSIEPDAATKLDWLRSVHRKLGAIDAGGKVVDLYGAGAMTYTTVEASRRTGL